MLSTIAHRRVGLVCAAMATLTTATSLSIDRASAEGDDPAAPRVAAHDTAPDKELREPLFLMFNGEGVILSLWPDGLVVRSLDCEKAGADMAIGEISRERVDQFLGSLRATGALNVPVQGSPSSGQRVDPRPFPMVIYARERERQRCRVTWVDSVDRNWELGVAVKRLVCEMNSPVTALPKGPKSLELVIRGLKIYRPQAELFGEKP